MVWMTLACSSPEPTAGSSSPSSSEDVDSPSSTSTSTPTAPTAPTPATGDTAAPTATGRDYSSDRGKFFGDSRCGSAGVWRCDGFEAGAIDYALWSPHDWAPGPELDATFGARGSGSLHFHVDGNGFGSLQVASLFPVEGDAYWGRLFVWFDALPTAPIWSHWTIVGAAGPDVPGEIRVGGQFDPYFGGDRFGVGTDGGATGDWTFLDADAGPEPVPVRQWICVEWRHDGAADETRFFWDAVEHPSLATTATQHGGDQSQTYDLPSFDSLWIGWWEYQADPVPSVFDLWIDEVALDGERIGCVL